MHLARKLAWLSFAALPAAAIYQDEAYKIDYQHALLGAPVAGNTQFYQPTLSSRATLLYTLSEKNVVGAVNPKDGALVWRQRLEANPACPGDVGVLGGANGTNAVISAYGGTVTAWEAASGRKLWSFEEKGCVQSLVVPDILGVTQDPVVLMNDGGAMRLTSLNSINGKVIWQVIEDIGDLPLSVAASASHIFYVALQPVKSKGYNVKVIAVDIVTAVPTGEETLNTAADIASVGAVLHIASRAPDPFVAWQDKSMKNIKMNILGTTDITTIPIPKSDEPIEQINFHAPNSPKATSHFLIHYQTASSHWAEVYHVDKETKQVKRTYELAKVDGPGSFSASTVGTSVFFTRLTQDSMVLHFSSSSHVMETWALSPRFQEIRKGSDGASGLMTEVVTKGMSNYALRAAVSLNSDDWALLRNGDLEWLRSESLAGVVAASWAEPEEREDLARELAIESHDSILTAFIHRLARHAIALQSLPGWLQSLPGRVKKSITGASDSDDADLVPFGFQKRVIVATEKGRVAVIDAGARGSVLWSTQVADLEDGQRWNVSTILVAGNSVTALAEQGEAATLDLNTGAVKEHKKADKSSKAVKVLPVSTASGTSTMLRVAADGSLVNIPAGAFGQKDTVVTRDSAGALYGWAVEKDKAEKVWTFPVPEGEEIVCVEARPSHDPVASIGRALGDRNVLYKFLNPNTVLVITTDAAASTATVQLLDTVSGSTLHTTKHHGVDASKPVAATMSENWFSYTFFSDPSLAPDTASVPMGHVLTMSELFESPVSNDRGPLGDAANISSLTGAPYVPFVVSASYVLPTQVTYLATTSTRQGITPRSLLAYCPALAAILAIPVPLLSPRRPVGRDATAAEREEGLMRYAAALELNPAWTISHARDVLDVAGMAVSPTHMESTSLVFAYGPLDVFGTRLAPIGAFDILGNGFGKAQLILTVVALGAGTYFLAPMVRRRQIDTLWRS